MRRKHKRPAKSKRQFRGFSFGDRIRNQITRIKKEDKYVIEKSKYPEEEKKYIVVYKSKTERGCNCQTVYKGTLRQCEIFKETEEGW